MNNQTPPAGCDTKDKFVAVECQSITPRRRTVVFGVIRGSSFTFRLEKRSTNYTNQHEQNDKWKMIFYRLV